MEMENDDFEEEVYEEDEEVESNPELEAEFKTVYDKHMEKIEDQLEIASKAIQKAEKLSEKYGLPFNSNVSPLRQCYFPTSFSEKFGDLDSEFVYETTDTYTEYYDCGGWEHSAVC